MKIWTPSYLCVSSQVADVLDGSDEFIFSLMFPQRDLQARGITVLYHAHLWQPEKKNVFIEFVMQVKTIQNVVWILGSPHAASRNIDIITKNQ